MHKWAIDRCGLDYVASHLAKTASEAVLIFGFPAISLARAFAREFNASPLMEPVAGSQSGRVLGEPSVSAAVRKAKVTAP